ncbi:MAG: hypothetical protein IKD31_07110 [Clostridia bacterium]|nr:hypothetical protein [Clostridia bacterium]
MANLNQGAKCPKENESFTLEMLNEIPVANPKMSPEELRKLCLDFMKLQLSFPWVTAEEIVYSDECGEKKIAVGTLFRGVPFVKGGSGSIYRIMEDYCPECGKVKLAEGKKTASVLGNDSVSAACFAWSKAIGSAKMAEVLGMTQFAGYLNVGPYLYMKELPAFVEGVYTVRNVCEENGKALMLESYASLKAADGIQNGESVKMVSDVFVSRDAEGAVNGAESYVLWCAQGANSAECGIDQKKSFDSLFEENYLPFTFAEFCGKAALKKSIMRTNNILRTCCNTEEMKEIVLTASYPISDAFVRVVANTGEVLYSDSYHYENRFSYTAELAKIVKAEEVKAFSNGTNSLEVSFLLLNGRVMQSYRGFKATLCPGKTATVLHDKSLLEKMKAIPIAKESMTPDQLRKICVDFMRLQLSFPHKISEDYNYWIDRQDHKVYLKKEEVHGGLPYVNVGSGSLYRIAEFYDPETGVVDISELKKDKVVFGNACSGGCATSWARCITSARLGWTHAMTQANGVVPIGPYTYDKEIKTFHNPQHYTARSVCQENGEQTMFESYALLKGGDGLNNPGHIRMAMQESIVVRREDGTIDGDKSFAFYSDQVTYSTAWHHTRIQESGDHYTIQGGVDVKESFSSLYKSGYLPFTFKEFLGEAKVQRAMVLSNIRKTCFSVKELEEIVLKFNYPMSDAFYTVTNPAGEVVMKGVYRTREFSTYSVKLSRILPMQDMVRFEEVDGPFRLNVDFQLYNGQLMQGFLGFAGTIVPGTTSTEVPEDEKNLKEFLANLPIAKPGMSSFRLRQICLDYMKMQCQFPHKLSEDVEYTVTSQRRPRTLQAGIVHGGLPYVTVGSGNLYRAAEAYDPATATLDASMDCVKNARLFGNACSGGACISWSRAITSASFSYTCRMTQANGYLPVGPYRYSRNVEEFVKDKKNPENEYSCRTIIKENGEQTMFESYAAMLPADGVGNHGHVRMNTAYPVVVRREDGTIDGEKSYTLMSEQVCYTTNPNHIRRLPDRSHYVAQGGYDMKYTFKDLLDTNYIPFTFAEFIGEKEMEIAELTLSDLREAYTAEELAAVSIRSNYPISDVFVSLRNADGEEIYRTVYRSPDFYIKKMDLGKILPIEQMKAYPDAKLEMNCQLYNGEKLFALSADWKA